MTTLQLLASVSMAYLAAYHLLGVATYYRVPAGLKRDHPEWLIVGGWPLVWLARSLAESFEQSLEQSDPNQSVGKDPNRWRDETRGGEP